VHGYTTAFVVSATLLAAAVVATVTLLRTRGPEPVPQLAEVGFEA
jgi:hypothetical protein